ncbi:hypothetical protein C922_05501 [Plasmodium inui San Antonio 1]|uniref:Uncharacterized protein n=1 Tax=Plasmodium inui San Antonio 1 TaxID=1237626 RepID=W6ZXX5_9APIC|nr:hypothetical protein C922_05501 [Plasmodium inui San Antonio 1]EUD64120.1 hypothetical protein C922_05501 [Plasmodium inui San Antonio 1]
MTSFHKWLDYLLSQETRACRTDEIPEDAGKGRICDYRGKTRDFNRGGVDDRWANILGPGNLMFPNTSKAAEIVCRGLEKWAASLIECDNNPLWGDAKCDRRSLGLRGTLRGNIKCQWNPQHTRWEQMTKDAVLTSSRPENRSLMICMDMVSIIWGVFRNSERKGGVMTYGGENLCQAMYSRFKEWGNKDIAEELMKFWFPEGGSGIKIGGREYQRGEHAGGQWSKALYLPGNRITSLQCYRTGQGKEDKYDSSCYWTFEAENCEADDDTTWGRFRQFRHQLVPTPEATNNKPNRNQGSPPPAKQDPPKPQQGGKKIKFPQGTTGKAGQGGKTKPDWRELIGTGSR